MVSQSLLQRFSKYLATTQSAMLADCATQLQLETDEAKENAGKYPWLTRLPDLVADVSTQLNATSAGHGWVVGGQVSDENDGLQDDTQRLLLESNQIQSLFLRMLNRFQSSQAGQDGVSPAAMTELRQEAIDVFSRLLAASIAEWVLSSVRSLEAAGKPSIEAAPEPEPAHPEPKPAPRSQIEVTTAVLEEFRDALRSVGAQVGKLRVAAPAARDEAAMALRHLQRMASLLENIGVSAPPQPSAPAPSPTLSRVAPISVPAFLNGLLENFRSLAEQKGLHFSIHCDPALTTVDTDSPKLHRAASLLAQNAVQYTTSGAITIDARASGPDWLLTIEDTGPGIDPEKLTHLLTGVSFGPKRVPHGLAIARELIHMLGGHMDADSILHRGSRFSICLPRSRRPAS